jgi:hypothetical protein
MNSRELAYWLQGFFELAKPESITPEQLKCIKNHVDLCFLHDIDGGQDPIKQAVHDGLDPKVLDEVKKLITNELAKIPRPKVMHGNPKQIRC